MEKYLLPLTIFLLTLSMFFVGFQLKNLSSSHESHNMNEIAPIVTYEKGLMSLEETASYLMISEDELKVILAKQYEERTATSSFETYNYLPYIEIKGKMYFNKTQVDTWIAFGSQKWLKL